MVLPAGLELSEAKSRMTTPPVNLLLNNPYFYAVGTFTLGSITQPVNATTLITVDYSQVSPAPVFASTPIFSFYVDRGNGPPLVIDNPVWNGTVPSLTFNISRGIPGIQYTVAI